MLLALSVLSFSFLPLGIAWNMIRNKRIVGGFSKKERVGGRFTGATNHYYELDNGKVVSAESAPLMIITSVMLGLIFLGFYLLTPFFDSLNTVTNPNPQAIRN